MKDLDAGRKWLNLSSHDVWVGYFAVGGNGTLADVIAWLAEDTVPSAHDLDLLAQAINDAFVDQGHDHPVRYSDE